MEKILISTIRRLYDDVARPSAFSTLRKLRVATSAKTAEVIKAWVEKQDAYTLHRTERKRFARNLYTVSNVMEVWECDLLYVQAYTTYNDNYRYILLVIDVFSKYLYLIPIRTKNRPSVASRFWSVFDETKYSTGRHPIWVRTDKCEQFLISFAEQVTRRKHPFSGL